MSISWSATFSTPSGPCGSPQVEAVLAVDDQARYAGDLILLRQFLGLFDLALDGERVEGGEELVLVHTLSGEEVGHLVLIGQTLVLVLDGIEHRSMNLVLDAHGFEGQEHLAVCIPRATEHGRYALEVDVLRQLFSPRVDGRLEVVAVWAAVPEQLDDFDLARHGNRNRVAQLDVFLAGDRLGSLNGSHTEYAGGDQRSAENQFTHALLLSSHGSPRRDLH